MTANSKSFAILLALLAGSVVLHQVAFENSNRYSTTVYYQYKNSLTFRSPKQRHFTSLLYKTTEITRRP